jgi:hypothetical protein
LTAKAFSSSLPGLLPSLKLRRPSELVASAETGPGITPSFETCFCFDACPFALYSALAGEERNHRMFALKQNHASLSGQK